MEIDRLAVNCQAGESAKSVETDWQPEGMIGLVLGAKASPLPVDGTGEIAWQ